MKISIILAAYNAGHSIRRTLDCLLAQTYHNFELITVNDGSTDDTLAILEEYAGRDERIKVVSQPNGGASSARNLGLKHATGDYVGFCDADDIIRPKWLEHMVEALGDADMCCSGIIFRWPDQTHIKTLDPQATRLDCITEMHRKGLHGYMFIKLIRRSVIEENNLRFDTNFQFREDDVFMSQLLQYVSTINISTEADYEYFIDPTVKKHSQRYSACAEVFLPNVRKIYNDKLPRAFCVNNIDTARLEIIHCLLNNQKPSRQLVESYRLMMKCGELIGTGKERLMYHVMSMSRVAPWLSRWVVRRLGLTEEKSYC